MASNAKLLSCLFGPFSRTHKMLLSNHNYQWEPFFVILAPLEGFNMKTCLINMLLDELQDEVAPEDRRHRVQVPVEGVQHQQLEGLQMHFF